MPVALYGKRERPSVNVIPLNVWLTDAQALESRRQMVEYAKAFPRRARAAREALEQFDRTWVFDSGIEVG